MYSNILSRHTLNNVTLEAGNQFIICDQIYENHPYGGGGGGLLPIKNFFFKKAAKNWVFFFFPKQKKCIN